MRGIALVLCIAFLGAAAYVRYGLRGSFSSYSSEQLVILEKEMARVSVGRNRAAEDARVSLSLLNDERQHRKIAWGLLAGGGFFLLLVVFAPRDAPWDATSEEDQRLLTYLAQQTDSPPTSRGGGSRHQAAALLGVAVNAPRAVILAAFDALVRDAQLDDLDGLSPDLAHLRQERRRELEGAKDLLLGEGPSDRSKFG